jgi:hypothetical protein
MSNLQPKVYRTPNLATGETSAIVKRGQGNLLSFTVTNDNAAVRYIHLFDRITALVTGDVPLFRYVIAATSEKQIDTRYFTDVGFKFLTGITIGISTTKNTYTAGTAADHVIEAAYN